MNENFINIYIYFIIKSMDFELNKVTQGGFEPPTLRAEI